jgi:YHS domain-containing protein
MLKQLVITITLFSFLSVITLAQEKPEMDKKDAQKDMEQMHSDSSMHDMHQEMKMDDTSAMDKNIWNKVCPVRGEEVDPDAPTVEYNGKIYGFCCPGCDAKFEKNPEKYSKNLSEDGKKFIGKK